MNPHGTLLWCVEENGDDGLSDAGVRRMIATFVRPPGLQGGAGAQYRSRMGTIDLNHLAVFMALADAGGFTAAARRLGVPKSSVSRSIATLESAMGVQLVLRTTRRVALSTAGSALHARTAPLLAALRDAVDALPELGAEPSGELRVTAPVDFGAAVLAEIVARFVARHPFVQVKLHLTNELVDLVAEGFDLAVRISTKRLADSSLSARSAGPVTLGLHASPSYLARRGTPKSPRDLDGHEWIVFRSGEAMRLQGPGASSSVTPKGAIVCDDMSFVREAVRAGGGIGVLPGFLAAPLLATGELVRVLPRWSLSSGDVWIVCPSSKNVARKVAAFREFVVESLRARADGQGAGAGSRAAAR